MIINVSKTKVLTNTETVVEMVVGIEKLERVNSFVYLGSRVTQRCKIRNISEVKTGYGDDSHSNID